MVAFNGKVIDRFAVISAEDILCIPWFPVHFNSVSYEGKNSPEKVIGRFYTRGRIIRPDG